jgi:hypothetical protein
MTIKPQNRVLSLRLQRKKYPSDIVERYLVYRGNKLDITDLMFDELVSLIPEHWNSEKDRLIQFAWFEDKTFFCVRNKTIYNFSTKETEEKLYHFNSATPQQLDDFIKIIIEFFNKTKITEIENFYNEVYDSLSDLSFVKERIIMMRNEALSETDYMFNSDYKFKDDNIENEWRNYRQEWRDITESEFWVNNDFTNIKLPVAPKPVNSYALIIKGLQSSLVSVEMTDSLMQELEIDYNGYSNLASNFGSILFKIEILRTLTKLKIPMGYLTEEGNQTLEDLENDILKSSITPIDVYNKYMSVREIEESSDVTMKSILDEQVLNVEKKLQIIDEKLKEYNINFTIGDILQKFVEDMKLRVIEKEKEAEAVNLLNEIAMGETP